MVKTHPVQIVEPMDTVPQGESLVVTISSDEEEENNVVGWARQSHRGMKMVMAVGGGLKQRKDGISSEKRMSDSPEL